MNKDDLNLPVNIPEQSHNVTVTVTSPTTSSFANVIVVTTTASGSKPHSSTGGRLLLTSCTQRNSQDELDQKELVNRHDCFKLVRELNREVTTYRGLLLGLGSVGDCEQLREDLKKSRRKSQMLIKEIKTKLVPWIASNKVVEERLHPEWYRICTIFICCMDVLYTEMTKTLSLQQTFCLYSDSCSLINVGWNVHDAQTKMMGDNLSLDIFLEKLYAEREETMQLERELADLQQVTKELKFAMKTKFPVSKSLESISLPVVNNNQFIAPNTDQDWHGSNQSSLAGDRKCHYKRCICWTVIVTFIATLLAAVVILCFIFAS
ncbi:regulator of G protein signaling 9 binding protein [Chamberlinius hualienensis]